MIADNRIKQGGFARTIRTDQARDSALLDRQRDLLVSDHTTEGFGNTLNLNNRAHFASSANLASTLMPNHSGRLCINQPITPSWK